MRVAAAGKELLRQRDGPNVGACRLTRRVQRARPGRQDLRAPKRLLHANAGRAGKYELVSGLALSAKRIVGRILRQQAAEIAFRTEVTGGGKTVEREIVSLGALQRIVALVANEGKARAAHAGRKREERDFAGGETLRKIAGLHPPEIEAVGNRTGSRAGSRLRA